MGFFGSEINKGHKGASLELLHRLQCKACPLNKLAANRHPHMEPTGAEKPLIYILGEAPGKDEDIRNEQFVGASGQLLRSRIPKRLLAQTRFNNVVRTRPHKNAMPEHIEIECCRPSVELDIAESKPKVIIGFGNVPLKWVSGLTGIMDWRGRRIPVNVGGHECWYYPMLHPAYLLRIRREWARSKGPTAIGSEHERAFVFDMQRVINELDSLPVPEVHNKEVAGYGVETYEGGPRQLAALRKSFEWAKRQKVVGLDYETNCLRPYKKGSKILTAAIGTDEVSFAFAMDHSLQHWSPEEVKEIKEMWVDFLNAPVRKAVHNLAFELEWTGVKFDKKLLRASPWECTLHQASALDERKGERKKGGGPLSLDFLCKQYFGISLKALSPLDKANLDGEPLAKLLPYNAMDAKYHYLIYKAQRKRLKELELNKAYRRGLRRVSTCVLTQIKGVDIDAEETKCLKKKYLKAIDVALTEIAKLPAVKEFKKKFKITFNPESSDDVINMLRVILKRKEGLQEDGKYSTDKNVLAQVDHPIAGLVLQVRKNRKKESTYCYSETWPDGKLHAVFNSGPFTVTFRLSSEGPNLQNIPKREEGNREVRKQIIAPPGHTIVSIDYGQIEARVIAMASKDKAFVQALWDRYDVHAAWADRIAKVHPDRIGGKKYLGDWKAEKSHMKDFRTDIKNQWTFPLFFGAQLESAAGYLKMPIEKLERPYRNFKEEFAGVFRWQAKLIEFYNENGYVESLLGRRRRAPISKNELINSPIQTTACEIIMDGMNRLSEYALEQDNDYYQPNINIHDDLTFALPNKRLDHYLEKIITEMLKVPFSFVNVPITLEVSTGPDLLNMKRAFDASSDDWKVAA